MPYLVLSIGQIHSDGDSLIQFLCGHDLRKPCGAQILIIQVTEWMRIQVESKHSVIGGVLNTIGNAVSVKEISTYKILYSREMVLFL